MASFQCIPNEPSWQPAKVGLQAAARRLLNQYWLMCRRGWRLKFAASGSRWSSRLRPFMRLRPCNSRVPSNSLQPSLCWSLLARYMPFCCCCAESKARLQELLLRPLQAIDRPTWMQENGNAHLHNGAEVGILPFSVSNASSAKHSLPIVWAS